MRNARVSKALEAEGSCQAFGRSLCLREILSLPERLRQVPGAGKIVVCDG